MTVLFLLLLAGLAVPGAPARAVGVSAVARAERCEPGAGVAERAVVDAPSLRARAARPNAAPLVLAFRRLERGGLPAPRAPDA